MSDTRNDSNTHSAADHKIYQVDQRIADSVHVNKEQYQRLYQRSLEQPEAFWAEQAERIDWIKRFSADAVSDVSYDAQDLHIRWYHDGVLNVCANCIDRHLPEKADDTAIIWQGDEPDESEHISYGDLQQRVCRFANVLKKLGVEKGDTVTLYMPMIPAAAVAMLACARIGAVHSVVFGGFSPDSLAGRIADCQSSIVITADESRRGGKTVPLKANVDAAAERDEAAEFLRTVLVIRNTGADVEWHDQRDCWFEDLVSQVDDQCEPEPMIAEDPLFILYTSGSTGQPKGVLHTTGGYLVYASLTHETVFDYRPGEVYWCTADVGWITGHSYVVYGPLANGAITLMFEGVPTYPDNDRFWKIVDQHQVNILYTAPTAIRALMRHGEEPLQTTSRDSLRILGTVGEPINPEAWEWYYHQVGRGRAPIVDTWWQTETGGIAITPLPGATALKPGAASKPFFGIEPALLDEEGNELKNNKKEGEAQGNLVLKRSWPGQMRGVYGDHERFVETYFSRFPGCYATGDGARRDADGYYWITGRVDDVLNISGHRLGTAEVESALVAHPRVAEAAVVGTPDEVKGEAIHAFVTLTGSATASEDLKQELIEQVRSEIGPIATPKVIQWAPALPKTRSGKIMRRILRQIAAGETKDFGDTSTLAEPEVVEQLIGGRPKV